MSYTPYNPADNGKRFNEEAQPELSEISEESRVRAAQQKADLIADTHQELFGE